MNNNYLNRQKMINILNELVVKNGSYIMNGYIGDKEAKYIFDSLGNLEFQTLKNNKNDSIESIGIIREKSVIIKQIQKRNNNKYFQFISWDIDKNTYDYFIFDNLDSLENCYEKIKNENINISCEDIYSKFTELNISFKDIAQILLNQKNNSISII